MLGAGLLLAASAVAYYMYNKGPMDVKSASGIKVDAVDLYRAYLADSITAQKLYNGKVVEVKGTVAGLSTNQQNEQLVLLASGEESAYVNCTMEQEGIVLSQGQQVELKGICNGPGQAEPELGIKADLYLTRVYIKQ